MGACCVAVSGCATSGEGSVASGVRASDGASSTPAIQMSGGYEVDGQGRLVQPERSWPELVVDPVMEEESVEGVEAFARYFVAVAERARNTGNTEELERISSAACTFCSNLSSMISDDYAAGRWLDGMEYNIVKSDKPVMFPDDDKRFAVILHLRSSALAYFNGAEVVSVAERNESLELHICRESDQWKTCEAIGGSDGSS